MKLVRFGPIGQERSGILVGDGTILDLSGVVDGISGGSIGDQELSRVPPDKCEPVSAMTVLLPLIPQKDHAILRERLT